MNKKYYLAALHKIGLTHKNLFDLFSDNYDYDKVYNSLDYKLLSNFNLSDLKISKILKNKKDLDFSDLIEKIDNLGVEIITFYENNYPEELKNIFNPPYVLYIRGNIKLPGISFIGSRMMTFYGKKIIEKFIPDIGKHFTIISGGAIGCDTYSHQIALKNNIPTISVFGTGIDISYPSSNKKMYEDIIVKGGALISIFPLGEKGFSYNFPIRNEIVAGLSKGVFIVEAKEKSGTMITSKLALDLGKDLFCVAGDIFKTTSGGCNKLISSGEAKFVFQLDDVLNEYNIYSETKINKIINITDEEELKVYNCLINENMTIDDLMNNLKIDIATLSFKLSMLEISGYIKISPDGKYEIN